MTAAADLPTRMIHAAVCAYQIYASGVTPGPTPPVTHRVLGQDGRSFYDVVPDWQDAIGFAGLADGAPAFTTHGEDRIDAALAGRTADGYAVIALRGTIPPSFDQDDLREWLLDWAQDADVPPMPWRPGGQAWGHAETGFATAITALWPWIRERVAEMKDAAPKGVLVTGHSKGGAMTYLCASLIAAEFPDLAGRIRVFAFAPPVAGDAHFLRAYDAAGLGAATTRYQVQDDIVPFLPLWAGEDVWTDIDFSGWLEEELWRALVHRLRTDSRGGYVAPGGFVYFDAAHRPVPGAVVGQTALPAVVAALKAGDFARIAAAHSAAQSYLPCFAPAPAVTA